MDFWISDWISGFHSGFLDFTVDFWISVWISADGVRDFFRDGPLGSEKHNKLEWPLGKSRVITTLPSIRTLHVLPAPPVLT